MIKRAWLAFVLVALSGGDGLALDSVYGGEGAMIVPLKKTPIRVLSQRVSMEDAVLSQPSAPGWRVQAVYTLENPTDQPVQLQRLLIRLCRRTK